MAAPEPILATATVPALSLIVPPKMDDPLPAKVAVAAVALLLVMAPYPEMLLTVKFSP